MHQILIKNGTVIDGISKEAFKADVAINQAVITEVAPRINSKAEQIIDATDQFVTPGFIDIQNHSDSYWTLFDQPDQLSLLTQGITTITLGNCGSSLAPLSTMEAIKSIQKWHNLTGINVNWSSFEEYVKAMGVLKLGLNVGSLVGHSTLRRGLLGDSVRNVNPDEQKIMGRLLDEALSQGALGLSLGLVYAHEASSSKDELIDLARRLKAQNKLLSVHLRSEEGSILDAVDEALEIAEKCEIKVKLSHLKIRNKQNWHLFDHLMNKLETAFHQGLNISYDVYPYTSSWSVLYTYLPKWAYEGGRSEILKKLGSDMDRRKILDYIKNQEYDYANMIIASATGNAALVGRPVSHIAINQGVTNEEALLNVLSASGAQAMVFDKNLSEEQVEILLSSPLSVISSDAAGYSTETHDLVHPRCFGTMPKFLKMVRDSKFLKWEHAIKKITSEPAKILGFENRGIIRQNAIADVVVFDPKTINSEADYTQPFTYSEGINHVILNGKVALSNRKFVGSFGEVILR